MAVLLNARMVSAAATPRCSCWRPSCCRGAGTARCHRGSRCRGSAAVCPRAARSTARRADAAQDPRRQCFPFTIPERPLGILEAADFVCPCSLCWHRLCREGPRELLSRREGRAEPSSQPEAGGTAALSRGHALCCGTLQPLRGQGTRR